MSRFSDSLMEHYQDPTNRGAMACPDSIGRGSLGGYPPFVTFYLRSEKDRGADATFEAEGCGVTIACASMLTVLVTGRSLTECRQLSPQDLISALDGVPADKEHCVNVAILALRDALAGADAQGVGMLDDSPKP